MQMKKKFQILVHHRKMWEHKKSITIQCMIRKKQATNKVKRKRFQYHTKMSKKIQLNGPLKTILDLQTISLPTRHPR